MYRMKAFISAIHILFIFKFSHGSIHKNLQYFETLHADDMTHRIIKRGTEEGSHPFNKIKEVNFKTLGRDFRLILTNKREVLHSYFQAYELDADGNEKQVAVDHESFYHGRVFGELQSEASVHIGDEGVMTATIHLPEESYHIEPAWRHLPESDPRKMVTYRASDVKLSWEHEDDEQDDSPFSPNHKHHGARTCGYIREGPQEDDEESEEDHDRGKRQADNYEYTPTKTRCPLLLVADYRFYQEMGGASTKNTINYLISLIDRVHKIYNDTIWHDRAELDGFKGMGFVIKKIVVHSEPTRVRGGEAHYNMVRDKWDVRNLLEVFSREYSHKDFCLAHLFTDLKFEGGILGLAYVGSPRRNSVGGICTPEYFKNGYTLYLNSGLSSSRNHYGQRVITREADLVTAHEFGHNWGSEHDPDIPECSPGASQGGSYLMYTYSVSGYDINNKRFSPCSLRSIRKVLQAKSGRCFSEPEESFCGNLRVEGDEECDIGLLGTDDLEPCCDKNCRLRRDQGAACSDKNSPCCQDCQFMKAGTRCREAQLNTCEQESLCTGTSPDCPRSPPMKDNTACLDRGQCRHGKCVPFCEVQGLQSCMCDTIADACKRCCRMLLNVTCFAHETQETLPNGTPCIHGFCNNGLCEKTIQDGVERFWDIIEDININRVLLFLKDNLVGTVLIVTALLWLPASCLVSYVDRRRRLEDAARWEWRTRDELLHPRDPPRRVIYARNIPTVSTSAPTPQSNQAAQATPLRRMHLSSLSAPLH